MDENKSVLSPASRSSRLLALLIDDAIILLPTTCFVYFSQVSSTDVVRTIIELQFVILTLYLLKDIFGRSPGKAILGLRIVRQNDFSKRANPFVTILRNSMGYFLFGIEALVIMFNKKGERLADMATGTIVVSTHPRKEDRSVAESVGEVTDDSSEPTVCVVCRSQIRSGESRCPKCGWSYKE